MSTTATDIVDGIMEATVVPSFTSIGPRVRRRLYDDWQDLSRLDLRGKTVLITGGNSGLGQAAATQVAKLGASLRLFVRSEEKGETTRAQIREATGNDDIAYDVADLADFDSVRGFADRFRSREDRLDVLLHNAGAMFEDRRENGDGIERTFAVHVAGQFLLTAKLLDLLEAAPLARVVTMSSGGMYSQALDVSTIESPDDYSPTKAYARAKRAQVVLAEEWTRRFGDRRIVFHTVHPGWADTPGVARSLPTFQKITGPLLRNADEGADTMVWLAAAPEAASHSGAFWLDRRPRAKHKVPWTRTNGDEADKLWDHVVAAVGHEPQ